MPLFFLLFFIWWVAVDVIEFSTYYDVKCVVDNRVIIYEDVRIRSDGQYVHIFDKDGTQKIYNSGCEVSNPKL